MDDLERPKAPDRNDAEQPARKVEPEAVAESQAQPEQVARAEQPAETQKQPDTAAEKPSDAPTQEQPAATEVAASSEPSAEQPAALPAAAFSRISRRELLKLTPLVLAGAFVVPKLRDGLLARGVALSDWASGEYFGGSRRAPVFANSAVVPFERFPYNGYDVIDPEVDLDNWTLTVEGAVTRAGDYKLAMIQALPKVTQNTRHICVEGWDVIGSFGGARVSDFLTAVGADPQARFLEVECADDYYESLDMATAMHPQSLLCYEMYGKPLDRGHGAPLRFSIPTKLGYKQPKYLTKIRVTNVLSKRGYWEDQGYSWFGGI
jgi:DMSO/TMAO reductase YedYZ molybdopterin-dependent catalytic subunit